MQPQTGADPGRNLTRAQQKDRGRGYICWGDEIDLFKNGLCSTLYSVNACAQAAFLVGDVMLLTMACHKVKRNGRKPAVQNLVYVCNINFMFMLCLCLVYAATSCVKKQKSFCACVYDVRIVQYDWSNNRSQALFKTIDHRSRLPNKYGCGKYPRTMNK